MRSIAAGLIVAALLLRPEPSALPSRAMPAGWPGARTARHAYYTDEGDLADDATVLNRLPPPLGIWIRSTETRHEADRCLLARAVHGADGADQSRQRAAADRPRTASLAANAAFRTSAPQSKEPRPWSPGSTPWCRPTPT